MQAIIHSGRPQRSLDVRAAYSSGYLVFGLSHTPLMHPNPAHTMVYEPRDQINFEFYEHRRAIREHEIIIADPCQTCVNEDEWRGRETWRCRWCTQEIQEEGTYLAKPYFHQDPRYDNANFRHGETGHAICFSISWTSFMKPDRTKFTNVLKWCFAETIVVTP